MWIRPVLTLAFALSLTACGGKSTPAPAPTPDPTPAEFDLSQLGSPCGDGDTCATGLTCTKYYGIAGPSGPEFKSCEVACPDGGACPDGAVCSTIADGPGAVCREPATEVNM